jgi:hypothetical protein
VDYDIIGYGSAQTLFDEQLDVRKLLRGQTKTEWVIVSTGVFTSYLFSPFFGIVDMEEGAVHALGSLENRVTVTTVEDIGRLTAEILNEEPRIRNSVVHIAGDTLSYLDIVQSHLGEGRTVKREAWEVSWLEEQLKKEPNDVLRKYRVVFAKGKGAAWDMESTFNFKRGIPVVSAERYAEKHLR